MFVLVAGAEHSVIDSKDYYKSILTPFELEIALTGYVAHEPCFGC